MPLINEANVNLSDREILLLLSKDVNTLNCKVDEIRTDNAGKYEALNKAFEEFKEETNKRFNMAKGAGVVISGLVVGLQLYIQYIK